VPGDLVQIRAQNEAFIKLCRLVDVAIERGENCGPAHAAGDVSSAGLDRAATVLGYDQHDVVGGNDLASTAESR
jgi:hypothetical protein